jgi:hypothetical protein
MESSRGISARSIQDFDSVEIADLLSRGLGYPKSYFLHLFDRLGQHPTPAGFPKYGYVLTSDGTIVGAILLIFSNIWSVGGSTIRCHVTSWYVEPDFRPYATLFFSKALKHNDVTYINISARRAALPILKVQGFLKYSCGQFASVPLLHFLSSSVDSHAEVVEVDTIPNAQYEPFEREVLMEHARYGCISVWCISSGRASPFVFQARAFKGLIPGVQLIYCRDIEDFTRFIRPLGIFLASRCKFIVRLDANGPIPGVAGIYFEGMEPRYYKGQKPRLGDLTFTQTVMCRHIRKD